MSFNLGFNKIKETTTDFNESKMKSTPVAKVAPELKQYSGYTGITKTCAVLGCDDSKNLSNEEFFRFPEDPARRQIWTSLTGRSNWTPTDYSYICVQHFSVDCFYCNDHNQVLLTDKAVPTRKLPSHVLEVEYIDEDSLDNDDVSMEAEEEEEELLSEDEEMEELETLTEINQSPTEISQSPVTLTKSNANIIEQENYLTTPKSNTIINIGQVTNQTTPKSETINIGQLKNQSTPKSDSITFEQLKNQVTPKSDTFSIVQLKNQTTPKSDSIKIVELKNQVTPKSDSDNTVQLINQVTPKSDSFNIVQLNNQVTPKSGSITFVQLKNQVTPKSDSIAFVQLKNQVTPKSDLINVAQLKNQVTPKSDSVTAVQLKNQVTPKSDLVTFIQMKNQPTPKSDTINKGQLKNQITPKSVSKNIEQVNKETTSKSNANNLELLKLFSEVQKLQRQAIGINAKLKLNTKIYERQNRFLNRLQEIIEIKKKLLDQKKRKRARILLSLQDKLKEDSTGLVLAMPMKYTDDLKNFALSIYKYSPQAYIYIRNSLRTLLPNTDVLEGWIDSGFTPKNVLTTSNNIKIVADQTETELSCKVSLN